MADTREPTSEGLDEEERVIVAALKAVREKKARFLEEQRNGRPTRPKCNG
jgi:hypothetical protein